LHGWLRAGFPSSASIGELSRPAIIARQAIVPRSSDRGILI